MRSRYLKNYLPEKYKKIDKLKSLLINSGNKEKTNSFLLRLLFVLKTCARIKDDRNMLVSFTAKNPIYTLGEKNPLKILDKCLYNLMPAFTLQRTFVAGRFYNLPVPISDNHARFMAADWLRKAAFKDNKSAFTVPYLLAREVGTVLHNNGSACTSLQNYIETALDQRPFSRYIRKKRKIVAISKQGYAAYKLNKQHKKIKKIIKLRKTCKKCFKIKQKKHVFTTTIKSL